MNKKNIKVFSTTTIPNMTRPTDATPAYVQKTIRSIPNIVNNQNFNSRLSANILTAHTNATLSQTDPTSQKNKYRRQQFTSKWLYNVTARMLTFNPVRLVDYAHFTHK